MGGAKSTCTMKSSTAGLHGMYLVRHSAAKACLVLLQFNVRGSM